MQLFLSFVFAAAALFGGPPMRVVSQTVGTDELLLAIAEPSQIAALSHLARDAKFSPVAKEAENFPFLRDSDAESILRYKPDLVLVSSYTRAETRVLLERAGVKVLGIDRFESLENLYANARKLGEVLGRDDQARKLIQQWKLRVEQLRKRLTGVKPVRVLAASVYPFTAGRDTTFQDLCEHAGAINVAAGLVGHKPTPSEKLLLWDPEVLVVSSEDGEDQAKRLREISPYKHLSAIAKGRMVLIPSRLYSATAQGRIDAYEMLARALHPERFR
jgi:iron complex transport system substrate-binding protein